MIASEQQLVHAAIGLVASFQRSVDCSNRALGR
jgi:hypothetical protein